MCSDGSADDVNSVAEMKRQLEAGRCFVSELPNMKLWFEFVETVGPVRTETNLDDSDPYTTSAGQGEMRMGLRYGLSEVDCGDIPVTDDE